MNEDKVTEGCITERELHDIMTAIKVLADERVSGVDIDNALGIIRWLTDSADEKYFGGKVIYPIRNKEGELKNETERKANQGV